MVIKDQYFSVSDPLNIYIDVSFLFIFEKLALAVGPALSLLTLLRYYGLLYYLFCKK